MTKEYAVNTFTKDMTKRPYGEEYQLKDDLGSWELVGWKAIAATTDLKVPKKYEWY